MPQLIKVFVLPNFDIESILNIFLESHTHCQNLINKAVFQVLNAQLLILIEQSFRWNIFLQDVSMYSLTPEKFRIFSLKKFQINLSLSFPYPLSKEPFKIFLLPVNSGWKPVPTSSELVLPIIFTEPDVGALILDKILVM